MASLLPVLSVSGLLLLGFAVGKILPPSVLRQMLKPLSAVVLLLLFLMGRNSAAFLPIRLWVRMS